MREVFLSPLLGSSLIITSLKMVQKKLEIEWVTNIYLISAEEHYRYFTERNLKMQAIRRSIQRKLKEYV